MMPEEGFLVHHGTPIAGELGLGVLAFTFDAASGMREKAERYKERIASCTEPVGQFKNDNIMTTTIAYCAETSEKARKWAMTYGARYVVTLVTLYHDSFPMVFSPRWPLSPDVMDEQMLDAAISGGFLLCGSPDEVCEQLAKRDNDLVDQLVFTNALELPQDDKLEHIELLGSKVIPEFDTDPIISTDRYRAQAEPKFGPFGVEPAPLETIWTNTSKGAPF